MRFSILGVVVLHLLVNSARAGRAGEDYLSYVSEVLPLSQKVVEKNAALREFMVFVDRASRAQSMLVSASSDVSLMTSYSKILEWYDGDGCPRSDGMVRVQETLRQLFVGQQIINHHLSAARNLESYRKLEKEIAGSCSDENSFKAYLVKNLGLHFFYPGNVPLVDNENAIELSFGGGQDSLQQGVSFAIPLVTTLISLFQAKSDNDQFEEGHNRLKAEQPTDASFQAKAKESCLSTYQTHKEAFLSFAKAEGELSQLLTLVPLDRLRSREAILRTCLKKYESDFTEFILHRAAERAAEEVKPQQERGQRLIVSSAAKKRVILAVEKLKSVPCDEMSQQAGEIEADLNLLEFFVTDRSGPFLMDIRSRYREAYSERRLQCPVSPL